MLVASCVSIDTILMANANVLFVSSSVGQLVGADFESEKNLEFIVAFYVDLLCYLA